MVVAPLGRLVRVAAAGLGALALVALTGGLHAAPAPPVGALHVSFLYLPPTGVEPTYHTAMWLEDAKGALVRTLFVSQELSVNEYKLGLACPDWIKQSKWDKAPKTEVDAVTAPTPNVGTASMAFDLAALGVPPGDYTFKFQVHITEQQNVLHTGAFTAGGPPKALTLDVRVGPGRVVTTDQFVKDVDVRYVVPQRAARRVP